MELNDIKELIALINDSNLSEFKMKSEDLELLIRTDKYERSKSNAAYFPAQPAAVSMPAVPNTMPTANPSGANGVAAAATTTSNEDGGSDSGNAESSEANLLAVKSPIVGTFYRSPTPEKPAYAKVGDLIEPGSVVCIVEAMKLFNEIESEIGGRVVKVLVEDAQPVEFDQPLFLVDPNG